MDQVSRPLLIALAATVAFVAVWFVALKPKPVEVSDTPLAPTTAIPKATAAADASNAANAKLEAAAGRVDGATSGPATPAAATATKPAAPITASKPSVPANATADNARDAAVLRDINARKVVVMLFWNAKSADDIATRSAVRGVDRHDGKVAVHVVPIGKVGQYDSVTRGVSVVQSPTTVVIDRKRQTRVIIGLTEPHELKQAVGDALAGR